MPRTKKPASCLYTCKFWGQEKTVANFQAFNPPNFYVGHPSFVGVQFGREAVRAVPAFGSDDSFEQIKWLGAVLTEKLRFWSGFWFLVQLRFCFLRARETPININTLGRTMSGTNQSRPRDKRDPFLEQNLICPLVWGGSPWDDCHARACENCLCVVSL